MGFFANAGHLTGILFHANVVGQATNNNGRNVKFNLCRIHCGEEVRVNLIDNSTFDM
jgi:hypothetical protein